MRDGLEYDADDPELLDGLEYELEADDPELLDGVEYELEAEDPELLEGLEYDELEDEDAEEGE